MSDLGKWSDIKPSTPEKVKPPIPDEWDIPPESMTPLEEACYHLSTILPPGHDEKALLEWSIHPDHDLTGAQFLRVVCAYIKICEHLGKSVSAYHGHICVPPVPDNIVTLKPK